MSISHVPINALNVHIIHINLNTIFYTHVEHRPTKTNHTKHHMERPPYTHTHTHTHARTHARTHNDCSRNWVLILVGAKILWEKEGFQFGFKRCQGWAASKVLWEWIPNSKFLHWRCCKFKQRLHASLSHSFYLSPGFVAQTVHVVETMATPWIWSGSQYT